MRQVTTRRARRGLAPGMVTAVSSGLCAVLLRASPAAAAETSQLDVAQHPAAIEHLPFFITRPGQTDVLMVAMGLLLVCAVLGVGVLFLRIHTLPERMAHRSQKLQFEIVAVLGLLALFTHIHLFWVAGLLLALIELPDLSTPLARMARAQERMAGIRAEDPELGDARPANDVAPLPDGAPELVDPVPQRPAARPRLAEGG
jgi:hypothetical protein